MSEAATFAYALWCDDFRQEVGNKVSLMGIYQSAIVVPSLPIVLPRLTAWVTLSAPFGRQLAEVSVAILRDDGEELLNIAPFTPNESVPKPQNGVEPVRSSLNFALTLSPLSLPAECKYLTAVVRLGTETFTAQRLHVQVQIAPQDLVQVAAPG